jgi:DNA-binding NarL/FixJ family response regulator
MSRIRVLVIEDEPLIAAKIEAALNNINFEVAGIAYTLAQAHRLITTAYPDAVLIDINIEGNYEGLELGKLIDEKYQIPFVYLTAHADRETLARAKLTNPAGYIVKPFEEEDLLVNLELALHRHAQLKGDSSPEIDFEKINARLPLPLSNREIDTIKLIYQGKTNQQMAEELNVSVNTIKTYILKAYQKLDVHSRSQLLAAIRK